MNHRCTSTVLSFLVMLVVTNAQNVCMQVLPFGTANGQPRGIVAGNFNDDAFLDVATANYFTQDISLCFGNGDGTFQPAVNIGLGAAPTDLIAGDLNSDGWVDIAASVPGAFGLMVLLNQGGGGFAAPALYNVPCCNIWTLMALDVDGDEVLDLLAPNSEGFGMVYVLHGNGDGTFQTGVGFNAGIPPISLDVADLNEDGFLDVIYAHLPPLGEVDHYFCVLWGTGPGTFGAVEQVFCPNTNLDAIAADVNGDGHVDVLTANFSDGSVSKFLGQGDGTFAPVVTFPASLGPSSLQLADMNMDGSPELVLSDYDGNAVDVMQGDGTGVFGGLVHSVCAVDPEDFAVGLFNGDQWPDIVVGSGYDNLPYFGIVVNCLAAGVEDVVDNGVIELFSTPADEAVIIHVPDARGTTWFEIMDAAGRLILTQPMYSSRTVVNTATMAGGTYMVRVIEQNGVQRGCLPFMVMHP